MQTQNFHSHTWRCHHAEGTEREYVEYAIKKGMTHLGFSDHAPYVFEGDYYSSFRMHPAELENYVKTILDLRKEYAGDIEIHLGLEAEYYPRFFEAFQRLIEPYPLEYLLLGQHFLGNEMGCPASGSRSDDEERLKLYVNQTNEALMSGAFACFAHPDIIWFTGERAIWRREMRKLCQNAQRAGVPLEINLLGLRTNRSYPCEEFWQIAGEVGNDVVFGSDAHNTEDVVDQPSYDRAMEWVKKYGLHWREASWILKRGEDLP